MSFNAEEKAVIQEAMQVYLQIVARQLPQQRVQQVVTLVEGIINKVNTSGQDNRKGNKPAGITDEWYKRVCRSCDKLGPSGCTDKVTEKFPGKCDPILIYERKKKKN